MHFGILHTKQDHAVTGVPYDMRSVYEGLSQLSDLRKAREKLSRSETVTDDHCDGEIAWEWLVCVLNRGESYGQEMISRIQ